jgi:hypothetical protein
MIRFGYSGLILWQGAGSGGKEGGGTPYRT